VRGSGVADSLNIDSLGELPELTYCRDRANAGLRARFVKVIRGIGVSNVFNPSFHENDVVSVFAFRAIPDGTRDLVSFVSVEDRSGSILRRISPELFRNIDAPRLIDPKVFTVGDDVYVTFNSGWVPAGGNDIFVMKVYPTLDEPMKVVYEGRRSQERNWAFFGEGGEVYAIYQIAPLVILRLEKVSARSWRLVDHVRRQEADLPHDLTLGTQASWHAGRYYFMAHRKYALRKKKVYLGRLCALDFGNTSVTAGEDWMIHSPESLLGSAVKHNTNLFSCTYFSGLQASDSGIALGYGINDVDFGFSSYGLGVLLS